MASIDDRDDSTDGRIERAKDAALGAHHSPATHGDELGEATGGITGVLTGWWAGRAVSEAARALTHEDEAYYRSHYDTLNDRPADRAYDDVRGAYYLGHIASHNPNFTAREFAEVEPELQRGWEAQSDPGGTWTAMRRYAAEGFSHGRSRLDDSAARARGEQEGRTSVEREDRRA
jgi:hypothetical protein